VRAAAAAARRLGHAVGDGCRGERRRGGSRSLINRPTTHISRAYPDRIDVRGRDLCGDLMGTVSFTEYFHLLLTGDEPTDDRRFFLDLLLVAIAEHGLTPTTIVARTTLAADPASLQGAVAAGILGCGPVVLGTVEPCARLLADAQARVASGDEPAVVALEVARTVHASARRIPGFGHPLHRPVDPRAERILELADERGVSGPHVLLARCLREAVTEVWEKRLTMNVSLPMAAVLLDLGFPPVAVKAIPILARTAGLLAHLAEEQEQPLGLLMAARAEEGIGYDPGRE
jgi:citrate synthase